MLWGQQTLQEVHGLEKFKSSVEEVFKEAEEKGFSSGFLVVCSNFL